ncbi:M56 family metallopeptidase [Actinomadura atramentaria]|uniref:M56 family metallopeptidase n=1 Tax=Actinomadura atramentaria TaxID=1990 RepID=UPI0003729503|nr:M56 family metallopeptidase [Actinomadura atramentaria]
MTWFTLLPAALTLTLGVVLGRVAPPLHPRWSARLLAVVAGTTATAVAGTALFVAVNYVATLAPAAARRLPEWALFGDDVAVPAVLGAPALAVTLVNAAVVARLARRWRADVRTAQRQAAGTVLDTDDLVAVAVPGRAGGVLVSRGLLAALAPPQLRAVLEHELAHLRHRHHRYLAAGALAAATLPPLRRLNERLRFAVERWADEDAAERLGDRRLVARTIAHVALSRGARPPLAPGFADSAVVRRVEALLTDPPGQNTISGPVTLAGTGVTTSGLASLALQLDQAVAFVLH